MKFKLEIDLENDAFTTYFENVRSAEQVARVLQEVVLAVLSAGELSTDDTSDVRDTNGNTVGRWAVEE